jgi:hypothetical protein
MKTDELTGAALDWAVAKCEGEDYSAVRTTNGIGMEFEATNYSTNWAQGGPIIEREGISVREIFTGFWAAAVEAGAREHEGPTPLIAAMRCFVASKLGDNIDIPEELK